MEISLAQLIPAILAGLAGLVGSACAWFVFARQLVTRQEVREMIRDNTDVLTKAYGKQEELIDAMRTELVALRGEVIRLGVLLGVERARDRPATAGGTNTKGN